jgi:hypothetical protein
MPVLGIGMPMVGKPGMFTPPETVGPVCPPPLWPLPL